MSILPALFRARGLLLETSILSYIRRIGGKRITQSLLRDFNACIDRCCLLDMKSIGSRFSWCNQQQGAKRILARLDRSLINEDWMQSFPASVVEYLNPSISDHSPMLIQTEDAVSGGPKPFEF